MATTPEKHVLDNRSAQLDRGQPAYHRSRGLSEAEAEAAAAAARAEAAAGDTRAPSGGGSSSRKPG